MPERSLPPLTARALNLFDADQKTGFRSENRSKYGPSFFDELVANARSGDGEAIDLLGNLAGGVSGTGSSGKASPQWALRAAKVLRMLHDDPQTHDSVRQDVKAWARKLAEIDAGLYMPTTEGRGSPGAVLPPVLVTLAMDHALENQPDEALIEFLLDKSVEKSSSNPADRSNPAGVYGDDDDDLNDPNRYITFDEILSLKPQLPAQGAVDMGEFYLVLPRGEDSAKIPALANRAANIAKPTAFLLYTPGHWMTLYLVPVTDSRKVDVVLFDSYGEGRPQRVAEVNAAVRRSLGDDRMGQFKVAGGDMQQNAVNGCGAFCMGAIQTTAAMQGSVTADAIERVLNEKSQEFLKFDKDTQAALINSQRTEMIRNWRQAIGK